MQSAIMHETYFQDTIRGTESEEGGDGTMANSNSPQRSANTHACFSEGKFCPTKQCGPFCLARFVTVPEFGWPDPDNTKSRDWRTPFHTLRMLGGRPHASPPRHGLPQRPTLFTWHLRRSQATADALVCPDEVQTCVRMNWLPRTHRLGPLTASCIRSRALASLAAEQRIQLPIFLHSCSITEWCPRRTWTLKCSHPLYRNP